MKVRMDRGIDLHIPVGGSLGGMRAQSFELTAEDIQAFLEKPDEYIRTYLQVMLMRLPPAPDEQVPEDKDGLTSLAERGEAVAYHTKPWSPSELKRSMAEQEKLAELDQCREAVLDAMGQQFVIGHQHTLKPWFVGTDSEAEPGTVNDLTEDSVRKALQSLNTPGEITTRAEGRYLPPDEESKKEPDIMDAVRSFCRGQ